MSIAVVITCFNEGAYIPQAIRSVLGQTAADQIDRIVIIDDGSALETLDILRDQVNVDRRIELILEPGNGLAKNRNIAISRVDSEYVAILDGDDFWAPDKLEKQMELIQSDNKIGLVYSALILFQDGMPSKNYTLAVRDLRYAKDPLLDYFIHDAPVVPSSILMRRVAFEAVAGFNDKIPVFEDTEFYFRLLRLYRLAALPDLLVYKRLHPFALTAKRNTLMKHHANVALHFAAEEPRLFPYVGRRLGERARKLGNLEARDSRIEEAINFYTLALSLDPFNYAARMSRLLLKRCGRRGINLLTSPRKVGAALNRTI